MTVRNSNNRPGDMVTMAGLVDRVFLRKHSAYVAGEGYGRGCTLTRGTVALVVKVNEDGDCYLVTPKGNGWLMQESTERIRR